MSRYYMAFFSNYLETGSSYFAFKSITWFDIFPTFYELHLQI